MKTKLLHPLFLTILLWLLLAPSRGSAQEPLSHYFYLESETDLPESSCAAQPGKLIGCMDEDALYLCNAEVIGTRKKGGVATVERWNLATMTATTHKVPLPPREGNSLMQNRYWLYAIAAHGQRLLLTTSDQLLEYELARNGDARLLHAYPFPDADFGYFDSHGVKAVAQVNDAGFTLLEPAAGRLDSVAHLALPAAFLLQFRPNALLKPYGNQLFFIPTPLPQLLKLDAQGKQQAETSWEPPGWQPLPDDYIREVQAMPYSGARAMHIFQTSTPYSFPLELYVLDDTTFLITYHQYDSMADILKTPLLLLRTDRAGRETENVQLTSEFEKDHLLTEDEFPFYYAHRALALMVGGNRCIVQVVKSSPEPYTSRTQSDYEEAQHRFFTDHPPVMKIRVLRMKPDLPQVDCRELPIVDGKGAPFRWDTLPHRRTVLVVNSPPQCHACEEGLYACLNNIAMSDSTLYIVERKCPDPLCRRERLQQMRQHLTAPFTPLYVPPADDKKLAQLLGQRHYPLVLLIDTATGSATVLSDSQLFPDDPTQSTVRPEARREISRFLR